MNREYCTLQRNLKDYRAMGYDVKVKLNAKHGVLLAEVERIEKLVEAAESETLDYPVVTATAEELEDLEVAYQAPESDWIEPEEGYSDTELMALELAAEDKVDTGYIYDGVDILAVNYIHYYDIVNSVREANWITEGHKADNRVCNLYGETCYAPACSLVYCDTTNRAFGHDPEAVAEVRVVGGYQYNDGFIRRTGTVTATMLTCDVCNYQQCELPEPHIHPDLGLVNGSSLTTNTAVDLSNLADVPEDDEPWCVICEANAETCEHSHDHIPCPCGRMTANDCAGECGVMKPVETITMSETEFNMTLAAHGFEVTPAVKEAFKDTTASFRYTSREAPIVALINNTYGFLTSKLVTKTLRSAWFWAYACLCVLWAMVQLTWQGLKLAAKVTYQAYKLATSPQALALYDLVITQTLTVLCNLTDYAETRWRLLWGFLDAGIELAIGLLPKRQPGLVKVEYFLD